MTANEMFEELGYKFKPYREEKSGVGLAPIITTGYLYQKEVYGVFLNILIYEDGNCDFYFEGDYRKINEINNSFHRITFDVVKVINKKLKELGISENKTFEDVGFQVSKRTETFIRLEKYSAYRLRMITLLKDARAIETSTFFGHDAYGDDLNREEIFAICKLIEELGW